MEIVLLIIAGIVLYLLYNSFQDYMKDPYKPDFKNNHNSHNMKSNHHGRGHGGHSYEDEYDISNSPYLELSMEDKIKKSEYGVIVRILKNIASSDGNVCNLEKELINNILDDIALEMKDVEDSRAILQNIFDNSDDDMDELAQKFCELSKGEYKKRVKVVEFLFALAYADGKLDEVEREKIIDVAAIFELNNDDFNKIYDDFTNLYSKDSNIDKQKALELLELSPDYSSENLEVAYKNKIKENNQNILLNKNLDKNFQEHSSKKLKDIDEAYKVLLESK